jgi:hypothetical protein
MGPRKKELALLELAAYCRLLEKLTAQKMANSITDEEFHLKLNELRKHLEASYSKLKESEGC